MKLISIRDVARTAGVSVGTVSMVLNGSDKVSEPTRQRVQRIIEQLGYRPNPHARSLSLNRSRTIGLVVTDLSNPFFGNLVRFMQGEVNGRDNDLMLGMTQNSLSQEARVVDRLVRSGVDGLILVPAHARAPDISHIRALAEGGVPLVFATSYYPGVECRCAMTDLALGACELARHLLGQGRRRIAFVSGYRGLVLSEQRIEGYKRAHDEAGVPVDERLIIEADPVYEGGYDAVGRLLWGDMLPDAVMSVNDLVCMGVLNALRARGVRVPQDVAVAGYDDLMFSRMLETPLTTVRQPLEQMCACAVDMLFERIEGGSLDSRLVLLPPELVVRASTST